MKTKLSVLLALATAAGSPGLLAQEQQPSQAPAPFTAPAPSPTPSTPETPSPSQSTPPPSTPAQPSTPPEATPSPQPSPPAPERRKDDADRDRPHRHGWRGDRDRGPDRDRDGDRPRGPRGPHAERPKQPQPFLGVMTSSVPPELGAQLGLPEDFGLLVQEVLPDSPAAKAGLQKYDILKLFNDQQLVDPNQLATLVRSAGKDASVSLTVIRKGQEQKVSVTIGERMMPVHRRMDRHFHHGGMRDHRGGPDDVEKFQDRVRKFHERARERMERQMRRHQENGRDNSAHIPSADILREARPGGGGQISIIDGDRVTTIDGSRARLVLKDQDGEIEVSTENGKRTLTAKNPKGEVVFSGPVNTEQERKAVPEQFRKKLERIHVRDQSDANSGGIAESSNPEPIQEGDFL